MTPPDLTYEYDLDQDIPSDILQSDDPTPLQPSHDPEDIHDIDSDLHYPGVSVT